MLSGHAYHSKDYRQVRETGEQSYSAENSRQLGNSFGGKPIGGKCEFRAGEGFPLAELLAFPLAKKKLPKKAKWLSKEAL